MDRFEIVGAYYILAQRYHSGQASKGYAILSRCARLGYHGGFGIYRRGSDERIAAGRLLRQRRHEIKRSW